MEKGFPSSRRESAASPPHKVFEIGALKWHILEHCKLKRHAITWSRTLFVDVHYIYNK